MYIAEMNRNAQFIYAELDSRFNIGVTDAKAMESLLTRLAVKLDTQGWTGHDDNAGSRTHVILTRDGRDKLLVTAQWVKYGNLTTSVFAYLNS